MYHTSKLIKFYTQNDFYNYKLFLKNYDKNIIYDDDFIQWFIEFYEHNCNIQPKRSFVNALRQTENKLLMHFFENNCKLFKFHTYFGITSRSDTCSDTCFGDCKCNLYILKKKPINIKKKWYSHIFEQYFCKILPQDLTQIIITYIPHDGINVLDLLIYQWVICNKLHEYLFVNYSDLYFMYSASKILN